MEEVGASTAVWIAVYPVSLSILENLMIHLHKEIAKAALIRASRANQIIQVSSKRNAFTRCRRNMYTIALPVAVVAEIDPHCCAFVEGDIGCWGGEDGGCGQGEEGGGELHVEQFGKLSNLMRRLCSSSKDDLNVDAGV
jgi:hypothetical protein